MSMDLERLLEEAERTVDRSKELETQLASLEATGTAADERVQVVVGSGGRVKEIRIDPRAMRLGSEELAEALMAALSQATDSLETQSRELLTGFWGNGSILGTLASGGRIDPYEFFESQGVNVPTSLRDRR